MNTNTHGNDNTVSHRTILAITLPIMLSNVSTPLLGMVDTALYVNDVARTLTLLLYYPALLGSVGR